VPDNRVALRDAFMATTREPDLQAEARKMQIGVEPNLAIIGEPTDKLVCSYANCFHREEMRRPAASRFPRSAVALEDGPPDPLQRKSHFKLFFEINDDDAAPEELTEENSPYAELFFNVDLRARRAWLRDKDPEYRLPLLRFLTGQLSPVPSIPLQRTDG